MLTALSEFGTSSLTQSTSTASSSQSENDKNDAIIVELEANPIMLQKPQDALFVAIHALLLETGFKLLADANLAFTLPTNWDAESSNGLFNATYIHLNDDSIRFIFQGLFVNGRFEVYISDNTDHTHSIELLVDQFVASVEITAPASAAKLLRNLNSLRRKFSPFAENIRPAKKQDALLAIERPSYERPPDRDSRSYGLPAPAGFPPVGRGDAFPPGLGGGDSDMLVGPNHPIFGHRGDPSVGPVPGARFDPFGPVIDPLGPSGSFRPPFRGPAPTMPFGGPGPDHLRMPRDDDMGPSFGCSGNNRGNGGFHRSDHSFS